MDDNPYSAPHAPPEDRIVVRRRFGLGGLIFITLGAFFVFVPAAALIWDGPNSIGAVLSIALAIAFGLLLIAHGVTRSNATMTAIIIVLLIVMVGVAVAIRFT